MAQKGFIAPLLPTFPRVDGWELFKQQFYNYLTIVDTTDAQKLPLFLNCIGKDGLLLFDGLPEPKTTYEEGIVRFMVYFTGRTSVLLRCKKFYKARQAQHEPVSSFVVCLWRISQECDFGPVTNTLMHDIFVIGICDDCLGKWLLAKDATTLTFNIALSKVKAFEWMHAEWGAVTMRRDVKTNFVSCGHHARHTAHKQLAEWHNQDTSAKERSTKDICIKCYRCGSAKHKANYI